MHRPPLPHNEEERLRTLRRTRILDSAPERTFDAIALRAAEICDTPIAVVSLVDDHRQWFKSRVGLDVAETARDVAFCSHAILQDDLMVVPDALADQRFADNPLVTGEPGIRFYAGMPLVTDDGCALGTLCVIDRKPRELTAEQTQRLRILAESVRVLLEMRASPMGEIFEKAVAATAEGVTVADGRRPDLPVIFANAAFYRMTGYRDSEVLGRNCRFLQGEATDVEAIQRIQQGLAAKRTFTVELLNYKKSGRSFWNRLSLVPILDDAGDMAYVVGLHSDVTEAKAREADRLQLIGMRTTMHTVNDIVLNFMNNLQLYRAHMEETWNASSQVLQEFDSIFEDTVARLSKINALTTFKAKTVARGISVLDTE